MERGTPMEKTIAVLGGDRRMALLARLLAEDGHPVRTWGLAAFGMEDTALEEAAQADRVVLPVPLSRGKNLNCTAAALPLSVAVAITNPLSPKSRFSCSRYPPPPRKISTAAAAAAIRGQWLRNTEIRG